MSDWRMTKETAKARQAFSDYLAMGPTRSLSKLLALYKEQKANGEKPPTTLAYTLSVWSSSFGWQARLMDIAKQAEEEARQKDLAYRREIMETGYATAHERIRSLKAMAKKLEDELNDPEKLWVKDVKSIGYGKYAEVVDIHRFNHQEVEQYRGLLADIAKEMGHRKERTVLEGDKDNPVEIKHTGLNLTKLTDEELANLEHILARATDTGPSQSGDATEAPEE